MKNRIIPWDVKELKNAPHPFARMQDKLLIVHHEATWGSHFTALVVHSLNCRVPLRQTLAIARKIKPCDSHLHNHCYFKCDAEQTSSKVQHKCQAVPVHAMNTYRGSTGIVTFILNFSTKWKWVAILPPSKNPSMQWIGGKVGSTASLDIVVQNESSSPQMRFETWIAKAIA